MASARWNDRLIVPIFVPTTNPDELRLIEARSSKRIDKATSSGSDE
jgi:hypothetical protein